ncbi:ganglioside GM2 activator-like [Ruditapes philippinarum]|uniref:ganglioside GM2 activator-like n=1 Tax=Ruditapes philippinarum TaxID=129788 RepID=UPI00295A81C7|nr:ganglioside GM2 activator-like [Ruditapes philippinarum]
MRILLFSVAVVMACVAAMPNVLEFEMEELEKVGNFIETKEDLIDFITEGHKAKKQQVKLQSFSFSDCGGPNALININQVSVTPDPIVFPGNLNVMTSFKINSPVGAPMVGDLLIEKKILGKFVKLPCIDNFGSCHYPDLCELLEQVQCPDPIVRIGIDCTCPLKANNYTLPKTEFEVDVSVIPSGDYHIKGNVMYMNKEAACLDLMLSFS